MVELGFEYKQALRFTLLFWLAFLVLGCAENATQITSNDAQKAQIAPWGFDLNGMDKTTRPGDDFYQYANGAWIAATEIPQDESMVSTPQILTDITKKNVNAIIIDASAQETAEGGDMQRIADLYRSYLDEDEIERRGLSPIADELAAIAAADDKDAIARLFARIDYHSLFYGYTDIDQRNPSEYAFHIYQGGLVLPSREYYLAQSAEADALRAAYREYITSLFTKIELNDPAVRAGRVLALETKIAEAHWTWPERRNRQAMYNKLTFAELEDLAPGYPFRVVLGELGVDGLDHYIVGETTALTRMGKLFRNTELEIWRDYLRLHLLTAYAKYLPQDIENAYFTLFGAELRGLDSKPPRTELAIALVEEHLGYAVGEAYVRRYFPVSAKQYAEELSQQVLATFIDRLSELDWMSEETRAEARRKVDNLSVQIGYPESRTDYSEYVVKADDLVGNVKRGRWRLWNDLIGKLGEPVDREEWFKTPQTVNAFYNFNTNTIGVSAAMLQPPFFDPNADPALNYGAIGVIIAHELSHGFDDQGRHSDADGVLRDWWSESDDQRYRQYAAAYGAQFAAAEPLPGFPINAEQTMGENISDLGGLNIAFDAYMQAHGETAPVLDGFSGPQRFFLGWAQVCRGTYREQELRKRIKTDTHSPLKYRVNIPVSNLSAWYDAFEVENEAAMWRTPEDRVTIW